MSIDVFLAFLFCLTIWLSIFSFLLPLRRLSFSSSFFPRIAFSWYVTLPFSLLFYINICIKQILYLTIFLASLCHSIFLIFSPSVSPSLKLPLIVCKFFSVFCCSSTICHSTHSLYVRNSNSFFVSIIASLQSPRCPNAYQLRQYFSVILILRHSLSLVLSHFLFITATLSVSSFPPISSHTIPLLFSIQVRSFTGSSSNS